MAEAPVLGVVARADFARLHVGQQRRELFVVVDLTALGSAVDGQRPSLAVVFVLDTSGSMNGAPLEQVKTSVERLSRLLADNDEVGVVAFADQPVVAVPPAPLGSAGGSHRPSVVRRTRGLVAGGGTGMRAGLEAGARAFGPRKEHQRQVLLLLTDGAPTDGSTGETLGDVARGFRPDVSTTTLGYGPNHNSDLLTAVAAGGGGQFWYIPDPSEADVEFARALGAQGDIVVDGVELVLRPAEGVEIAGILDGGRSRFSSAGMVVPRPDLRAEQKHTTVIRLLVDVDAEPGRSVPLTVVARHRRAGTSTVEAVEAAVVVHAVHGDDVIDVDAARKVALAQAEQQRAEARTHADQRRFDAAAALLRPVIARLEALPGYAKLDGSEVSEAVEQLIDEVMAYEQRPSAEQYHEFRTTALGVDLAQGARHAADVKAASTKSKQLFAGMLDQSVDAVVVVTQPGVGSTELPLRGEMTIGRVPGNDIAIPSGKISKRHTRLVCRDGKFIVVDLKSTNGTLVNGKRVGAPMTVDEGDRIEIGDAVLEIRRRR